MQLGPAAQVKGVSPIVPEMVRAKPCGSDAIMLILSFATHQPLVPHRAQLTFAVIVGGLYDGGGSSSSHTTSQEKQHPLQFRPS